MSPAGFAVFKHLNVQSMEEMQPLISFDTHEQTSAPSRLREVRARHRAMSPKKTAKLFGVRLPGSQDAPVLNGMSITTSSGHGPGSSSSRVSSSSGSTILRHAAHAVAASGAVDVKVNERRHNDLRHWVA